MVQEKIEEFLDVEVIAMHNGVVVLIVFAPENVVPILMEYTLMIGLPGEEREAKLMELHGITVIKIYL